MITVVPRLVRGKLINFGFVENSEKIPIHHAKILKEAISTLASLFNIVPNCKIIIFLLPKVNEKNRNNTSIYIYRHLAAEHPRYHSSTHYV